MEEFQGNFKVVKFSVLVLRRILRSTKVHRHYVVQRIKKIMNSDSVLAGIPFRPQNGALNMGTGNMGKLFLRPQVRKAVKDFNKLRRKSNQVLNTVRYRSLRRSAALLHRAG